jgi:hypothetical protein
VNAGAFGHACYNLPQAKPIAGNIVNRSGIG